MPKEPPFLEVEEYHLTSSNAQALVIKSLLAVGIKSPVGGWYKASFNLYNKIYSFKELLESTKNNGFVPQLQFIQDQSDNVFGGDFGMSTPTMLIKEVKNEYAGYTEVLTPPMVTMPAEYVISNDILFYREESCLYSDDYDFEFCTRYYRAYLSACISLVDAFINRHILIYSFEGVQGENMELLKTSFSIEDKLELLLSISCGLDIKSLNSGVEWLHFSYIRKLRNKMVHLNAPSLGYSIHEFADHYNYVRKGIGGLLGKIRELQGKPSLAFIERLKTAPLVYFNEIRHREDGNHIIKRRI